MIVRGSYASMWRLCHGSRVMRRAEERSAVVVCVVRMDLFLVLLVVVVLGCLQGTRLALRVLPNRCETRGGAGINCLWEGRAGVVRFVGRFGVVGASRVQSVAGVPSRVVFARVWVGLVVVCRVGLAVHVWGEGRCVG